MEYLTHVRMNMAIERLRQPDATVGEAAAAAGYSSESAFSRCFKRLIGTPPGSYRRSSTGASLLNDLQDETAH